MAGERIDGNPVAFSVGEWREDETFDVTGCSVTERGGSGLDSSGCLRLKTSVEGSVVGGGVVGRLSEGGLAPGRLYSIV